MSIDRAEKAKADTKKAMSDVGNKIAHAKADFEIARADKKQKKADALKSK